MIFAKRISSSHLYEKMLKIGTQEEGAKIMCKKAQDFVFHLYHLRPQALHILKQEALSVGADLATPKDALMCQKNEYEAILLGSYSQIFRIMQKCKIQPFGLKYLSSILFSHLNAPKTQSPKLMAILNLTPDSFYQQSRFNTQNAISQIKRYIKLGVEIIDIGAASSRPGSEILDASCEISRLQELLEIIKAQKLYEKAIFSIDTYNPKTAELALESGFKILNDISGFSNPKMIEVCSKFNATAILMHSKGTPQTMQSLTNYHNLFEEIDEFFTQKIEELRQNKIQNIILDIGFGFAKTMEQNLDLIANLIHFRHFHLPILVGASRKNTIGLLTDKDTQDRLAGTLALHQIALINKAEILRVHDVEEHIDMIKIYNALG